MRTRHKELRFFIIDTNYHRGIKYYLNNFPLKPIRPTPHITFEATPGYLYHAAKVARRIHEHLPRINCIAILRDPVKRAFSA